MSEDRTAPMKQPDWTRKETDPDEQKTVLSDQENVTPPTIPLGDQEKPRWGRSSGPGFVRAEPSQSTTPPPYPAQPPFRPSVPESGGEDQTMIISERPKPVFAWLVVVEGPDRNAIGTVHTLHPDTTTIGRVPGNRIILRDETVSAQHARVRREAKEGEEPVFAVFDMGSRNGIFVGDKETYRDDQSRVYRHELQDGDYLLVGETTLVFKRI
jgi:hypothetical protein